MMKLYKIILLVFVSFLSVLSLTSLKILSAGDLHLIGRQFEMYNIRDTEQEGVNLKVTKYSNV